MSKCGLDLEPNTEQVKEVYALSDSAIDQDDSDATQYALTGDVQYLKFNSDFTPVRFTVAPVAWLTLRRIMVEAKFDFHDVTRELFRIGCRGWRDWASDNGHGKFRPIYDHRPGQVSRLSDASFRRVPDRVALDIGTAVYNLSCLDTRLNEWLEEIKADTSPKDEQKKTS